MSGFLLFWRLLFVTLFVLVFKAGQSHQNALDPGYVNWEQYGSNVVVLMGFFFRVFAWEKKRYALTRIVVK